MTAARPAPTLFKPTFSLAFAVLFAFCSFPTRSLAREVHLTLLFTTNEHGQVEPIPSSDPSRPVGGVSRRMALINKIRSEVGTKSVLLVDGGDLFVGTGVSALTQGQVDCAAYQMMKYDAVAVGDDDFNYGRKTLLDYRKKFQVPWVSANAVIGSLNFVRPYVLKYAGVRVGFIGFSDPNAATAARSGNVKGITFYPASETAAGLHSILRKDADIFIALSRLGPADDQKLAKKNPFLHVIVDGSGGSAPADPVADRNKDGSVAGPLIVQAVDRGLYLGRLDLTIENRRDPQTNKPIYFVKDYRCQFIPVTGDLPEDADMSALIAQYEQEVADKGLTTPVGDLSDAATLSNMGDSPIGEWAADAVQKQTHADIALLDGGFFRLSPDPGTLTLEDFFELMPYDDHVVLVDMEGYWIRKMLMDAVSKSGTGGFLQVSGLSVIREGKDLQIKVGSDDLRDRQFYRVAMTDFLYRGGYGYDVARRCKSHQDTGLLVRDVIEKAMQSQQKISFSNLGKRWNL